MGRFMPFKKKGQSNMSDEDRLLPESPDEDIVAPKKKKKKKGKKSRAHDSNTKDGKIGAMLKFAKGKKSEKSRATVGSGSIAEDIFA